MSRLGAAASGVFEKRLRGFRVVDLGALVFLLALVLGVYAFKAAAGQEGGRIKDVDEAIAQETRAIRLARAEVARLEQPERLERLSTAYLGLKAQDARREAPVDRLPSLVQRPEPPPPPSASGAASTPEPPR